MVLPATNIQTAGMKKPTVNAALTARVGYFFRGSKTIMNENPDSFNKLDITVAAYSSEESPQ